MHKSKAAVPKGWPFFLMSDFKNAEMGQKRFCSNP